MLLCCCVVVLLCCCVVVLLCCCAVVVVVVQMIQSTPCLSRVMPTMHLIGWQNTGSKLPASPPPLPRPDGRGTLAVYLCTRPKKKTFPSHQEMQLRRPPQFSAHMDSMTLMVMSPYRYTSHFYLRHLSFNLNWEKL